MNRSSAPLVVITGPAGAGKSVLARQWLDQFECPTAWLTVDPGHNDPVRFWSLAAGALDVVVPALGWAPGAQVSIDDLDVLAVRMEAVAPFQLVIDDLHFLQDSQVLEQLDHLVRTLPERLRMVLVSRAAPRLRLARRSAEGGVVELHGRDLLFTAEETSRVLGRGAEDPFAATVQESTGGWPVAVGFVAHLHQLDEESAVPTRWRSRSRKHVADFLAQEVLWEQPAQVQDFLLETSILDEITVASANAIRSRTDAGTHLDYLGRNDVFLTLLDGTDVDTWGHHALVRDHLQRALERNQPDRWGELHRLAAAHFATRDVERAIHHALAAPDAPLAADLIERGMDDPRFHHRVSRVQLLRLLDALPDQVLSEHPKLRTAGLGLAATHRRPDLVHRWLAARPAGGQDRLEELFAQSWQANIDGDMPLLQSACRQALSLCEPGSRWWLTTHAGLTEAEFMMGNWLGCAESFSALRLSVLAPPVRTTAGGQESVRAFLPVLWCRAGDPVAAGTALAELEDWLTVVERQGYRSLGCTAWARAMVALEAGDVAGATRWGRLPEESVLKDQRLLRVAMSFRPGAGATGSGRRRRCPAAPCRGATGRAVDARCRHVHHVGCR